MRPWWGRDFKKSYGFEARSSVGAELSQPGDLSPVASRLRGEIKAILDWDLDLSRGAERLESGGAKVFEVNKKELIETHLESPIAYQLCYDRVESEKSLKEKSVANLPKLEVSDFSEFSKSISKSGFNKGESLSKEYPGSFSKHTSELRIRGVVHERTAGSLRTVPRGIREFAGCEKEGIYKFVSDSSGGAQSREFGSGPSTSSPSSSRNNTINDPDISNIRQGRRLAEGAEVISRARQLDERDKVQSIARRFKKEYESVSKFSPTSSGKFEGGLSSRKVEEEEFVGALKEGTDLSSGKFFSEK